ncbi:thioredoxin family protein [Neobacillus sp. CF12]|jgi:thiol-disulfide isomerase/thioredoxin|uniref:thioredoxin family protein n=1 Tax=Neobacillus sp. CF12 TaxID=3055864 RepID=UPI0025A10A2F|nr:thioredoxin family protein [Neobacillus sp. CF12]MDM5330417.1 thioredoxin family protein [Neobacillus sp. CF12]
MTDWNLDDVSSFLKNHSSGLIYFYTPLCGTCQVASRMLQVIEKMVDVNIGKMNLNFSPELANKFEIESVPCLLIIKDGEVLEMIYAFRSVPFLYEKIKQSLL